ncbi:hypothetical protein [Conexibacter sp. CPCC 206217]|uniref:hypothetical protein n=1 Tax=Conexibacter sp. CPCC 206217 TaxID=3064574 RepID=UPI002715D43B|nr:hypothetical protein [Conexibacter sp. CPCC 206217]MDO8209422.1 hypothetical protein [Conexibacter sp. CPCC 206217]
MSSRKRALPLLAGAVVALGAGPLADAAPAKGRTAHRSATHKAKRGRTPAHHVVLSGRGKPSPRLGRVGDVYLRSSDGALWGPKTRRGWGRPRPLARQGPAGRTGTAGRTGATGPAGPSLTPSFGVATQLAEIPQPGLVSAHWDADAQREIDDVTIELDVALPVGISLVTLWPRGYTGGMFNSPGCTLTGAGFALYGSGELGAPVSTLAVVPTSGTTAHLRCVAGVTPGDSREGTVAGTRVFIQQSNIALPTGLA